MTQPTFVEKSIPAISFNRAKENWNRVHVVSAYRDGRHTGQWQSYTWGQLTLDQHRLIAAWNRFGLQPGDRVALMAKNRPRWTNSFLSIVAADLVCVPVYPTLTADDAAFVLRDSGAKYVVADTLEQARKIASALPSLPELRRIIVMDALTEPAGEPIGTYDDLLREAEGRVDLAAINRRIETIDGDHLAAIIYTSGTTGPPKGVMLTHGNFLSQRVVLKAFNFTPEDVFLNHLPFCHSFGLTADLLAAGNVAATLVIAEGIEPEQIRHGLTTIRPTVLMSVPRLFEKLYVEVQRVVGGRPAFVQKLFARPSPPAKRCSTTKMRAARCPPGSPGGSPWPSAF
jgi:long-chain acyl-CoA synthetase